MNIKEQINLVVEARETARYANTLRVASYNAWVEENQLLFDNESDAKTDCQEAEAELKVMALEVYAKEGNKTVAPGVGILVMTKLEYDVKKAFAWAIEHKLALKLDEKKFGDLAKDGTVEFVTISEEPQATIATVLEEVK